MNLVLIRHGKTDAALENKRQSPSSPLGEYGKKQAKDLAEKLNVSEIDHLYSSDWPRALQTAEIISKGLSKEIKIHPLVHELEKSPIMDNIPDDSATNLRYLREMRENKDNFDWKFDNRGESLNEAIARAQKVIKFLETEHAGDTVAIVSHGIFITIMTILILVGNDFDNKTFRKLLLSLKIHNTGVCSFKFDPDTKYWSMICFNDHSHLQNET